MLDSALDGIVSMNEERRITEFNAAAERIFGYRREEAIGRMVEDLMIPPSLREAHIRGVTRYLATGESRIIGHRVEIQAMRSDHSEFPCELTISRVPMEGPPRFTAFIRDITERKRIETAIRESEERYRTLFSSIDEGFCIIEMIFDENEKPVDYRFLEVNPAFERQTGFADARGRRMRELVPNHEEHWFEIYGKVALTGEPSRFQSRAEQLRRSYDVYAFRFGEPEKRQVAVLFSDITGRLEIERNLAESRAQLARRAADLEQAVAARTAALRGTIAELEGVSYSLSHDMRAPLRTIRSFTEIVLAEAGAKLDAEQAELLRKTISAAGRLDRLIQDVLTYSRVSRETVSLDKVDIELLLRQIIDERPELQLPNAEIIIASKLKPVRGHEAYLTQCITNLLDNAVKFVPSGRQPRVRIWNETHDGQVRIYFEDNGIGIPKEAQNRIFGIFERMHSDKIYPGTGIGLAIVRKAVERMNGSLGVESAPGQGSRFWVQLPSAEGENT
jgi:PAS domain S-box-containing protein